MKSTIAPGTVTSLVRDAFKTVALTGRSFSQSGESVSSHSVTRDAARTHLSGVTRDTSDVSVKQDENVIEPPRNSVANSDVVGLVATNRDLPRPTLTEHTNMDFKPTDVISVKPVLVRQTTLRIAQRLATALALLEDCAQFAIQL